MSNLGNELVKWNSPLHIRTINLLLLSNLPGTVVMFFLPKSLISLKTNFPL
jgi:hypothetical protein